MAITTPDLTTLDPNVVAAYQAEILARLQAAFPDLDFQRGTLGDRVLYLSAVLGAALRQEISQLQASMTVQAIRADAAAADPDTAAAFLSNYFLTPGAGATASGPVTFVMGSNAPFTLAAGGTYTAGSAALVAPAATAVRSSAATITSASDQALVPSGSFYTFTVPLRTAAPGAASVPLGTAVVPDQPPPGFVSAYVAADFTGGQDPQSPSDMVASLLPGVAARTWSNRMTITAMLKAQPALANVAGLSIIGAGAPELSRARRGALPVPVGGKCDVYVRSASALDRTTLPVTATLLSTSDAGGTWRFAIGAGAVSGPYFVEGVFPANATSLVGGFPPASTTRGFDLSSASPAPDVINATEAAFTAYATMIVTFVDAITPTAALAPGATAAYTAVVAGSSLVNAAQTFLADPMNASPGTDVVVRGAVPCVVNVAATVYAPASASVNTEAVAAAMAGAVGGMGVGGRLYASALTTAAAPLLPPGAAFGDVFMIGTIHRPDGQLSFISSPVALEAPSLPDAMTTPNTVAFFLDPAAVNVIVSAN